MKYPDTKIELAAGAKDYKRPSLQAPYLDTTKAVLVATNGAILAELPVELDDDDISGPVPIGALKEARKPENLKDATECAMKCNGTAKLSGGMSVPRGDTCQEFPDHQKIIKDKYQTDPDIRIDVQQLKNLVAALTDRKGGSTMVGLWLARASNGDIDPLGGIRVEVKRHPERRGVIMPCRP